MVCGKLSSLQTQKYNNVVKDYNLRDRAVSDDEELEPNFGEFKQVKGQVNGYHLIVVSLSLGEIINVCLQKEQ